MLVIKIKSEAISLNGMYPTNKMGRRFLSKEGSEFKKIVMIETLKAVKEQGFEFDPKISFMSMEIFFYTPKLITKLCKLSKKKPDTSNMIKALEDAVFSVLKVDDCYNLDVSAQTFYSKEPLITVMIRTHSFDLRMSEAPINC